MKQVTIHKMEGDNDQRLDNKNLRFILIYKVTFFPSFFVLHPPHLMKL